MLKEFCGGIKIYGVIDVLKGKCNNMLGEYEFWF